MTAKNHGCGISGVMGAIFLLFIGIMNSAQALETPAQITVNGECVMETTADRGQLNLTVENLDKEVTKAAQKTSDQYNKLKKAFEKLSISDLAISTSSYQVFEQKEWENNKSVSKGFKASLGMKIESNEVARFSEIIKLAGEHGVTQVGSFTTFLSLEKQKKLALECLKIASKNAETKAKTLAESLSVNLGSAIQISELEAYNPPRIPVPQYDTFQVSSKSMAEGPAIGASTLEFSKKIVVIFELKK